MGRWRTSLDQCLYYSNTYSINQMTVPACYPDNSFTLAASSNTNSYQIVPFIDFYGGALFTFISDYRTFSIHSKHK